MFYTSLSVILSTGAGGVSQHAPGQGVCGRGGVHRVVWRGVHREVSLRRPLTRSVRIILEYILVSKMQWSITSIAMYSHTATLFSHK